jgi:hypothetical protein
MKWTAKRVKYRHEHRIAVYFEKNKELILRIKEAGRCTLELHTWRLASAGYGRKPQAV